MAWHRAREKGQLRDAAAWLARQDQFYARLQLLAAHGLPQVFALELARAWSQGGITHLQRAHPPPAHWAEAVGASTLKCVEHFMGEPMDAHQRTQSFLRWREGGAGLESASRRAEAAWVGGLGGGISHVVTALGVPTAQAFRTLWPAWAEAVDAQEARMRAKMGKAMDPAGGSPTWAAA